MHSHHIFGFKAVESLSQIDMESPSPRIGSLITVQLLYGTQKLNLQLDVSDRQDNKARKARN